MSICVHVYVTYIYAYVCCLYPRSDGFSSMARVRARAARVRVRVRFRVRIKVRVRVRVKNVSNRIS
jgi:hypothetical protein